MHGSEWLWKRKCRYTKRCSPYTQSDTQSARCCQRIAVRRSRDRRLCECRLAHSSNGSQQTAAIQWECTEGVALLSCSMHTQRDLVRARACLCVTVCVPAASAVRFVGFVCFVFRLFGLVRECRVYPEAALCIVPSSKRSIAQCVSQTRHLHSQKQCRQHNTQNPIWKSSFLESNRVSIPNRFRCFPLEKKLFFLLHLFVSSIAILPVRSRSCCCCWPRKTKRNPLTQHLSPFCVFVCLFACRAFRVCSFVRSIWFVCFSRSAKVTIFPFRFARCDVPFDVRCEIVWRLNKDLLQIDLSNS